MENIQEVVHEVGFRLDRFERDHFDFLQVGRAQRYDDSFALVDEREASQNRQLLNRTVVGLGLGIFAQTSSDARDEDAIGQGSLASRVESSGVSLKLKTHQPFVHIGTAFAIPRRLSRLNYVQWVTAFLILTFAAPISTQTLSAQVVVGRLITLPSAGSAMAPEVAQN